MNKIKSVCVYCSASERSDPYYKRISEDLGKILVEHGVHLVYGGGRVGLMGALADSINQLKGRVFGYMTQHLHDIEKGHPEISDLYVVETMHARKQAMFEKADAFIVLPGGFGTLDEFFEILTWKQLKLHNHPIIVINTNQYWTPLKELLKSVVQHRFAFPEHLDLVEFVEDVQDIIPLLDLIPLIAPEK